MIGKCKLCLQSGVELQRSHLIPAAVYRTLRDDGKAANPNPVQITREGRVQSSGQQRAHLLCRSCEAVLSREGENWIFRNALKKDGSFPLSDLLRKSPTSVGTVPGHTQLYESTLIPAINAAAITHFATGMFWKASIYTWNHDRTIPVNLFGYSDQFRRFLLGQADFPKNAVLTVSVRQGGIIDRLAHTPAGAVRGKTSSYQFAIPGFSFVLTIGKNIPQRISQYCFVRGQGRPIVISVAVDQFLFDRAQQALARTRRPISRS